LFQPWQLHLLAGWINILRALLEWIIGSRIVEAAAFQGQLAQGYSTPVEDVSTALLRFESGAHGVVDNCFNVPDAAAPNALEIYPAGSVLARGTAGQCPGGTMVGVIDPQDAYDAAQRRDDPPGRREYSLKEKGIYGQMVQSFGDTILEGGSPAVTAEDGLHSMALVQAIYRSAQQRCAVRV
jgi:predicted dehydrogenase